MAAKKESLKVTAPPLAPIFGRGVILVFGMFGAAFAASCWYCQGIRWLYADGGWPIISCPQQFMNTGESWGTNKFCRTNMMESLELDRVMSGQSCKVHSSESGGVLTKFRTCDLDYPCDTFCSYKNGPCPEPTMLPSSDAYGATTPMCTLHDASGNALAQVACRQVEINPYCESDFRVSPSAEIGIRGLLCACILILILWFIGELILRYTDVVLKREALEGKLRNGKDQSSIIAGLRQRVEERWAQQYELSKMDTSYGPSGMETPRGGFTPRSGGMGTPRSSNGAMVHRTALESRNPKRRFESSAWQRRLTQWKELRTKKFSVYKSRVFIRTCFLNVMFMILLVCCMYLIIDVSPSRSSTEQSLADGLITNASIWNVSTWLDIIVFTDVMLDVILFLLACCVCHWPRSPVFAKKLYQERLKKEVLADTTLVTETPRSQGASSEGSISLSLDDSEKDRRDFEEMLCNEDAFSLESVLKQTMTVDTCLMIACHESTLSKEGEDAFRFTLASALKVFPPGNVFVCDNGNSLVPGDMTQAVTQSVHPDINYVYIPEGNKTFAFYWTNRYWIPFLVQCGRMPDFKYALLIDDDVPLPADLHIPQEYLRLHPEVKAVHFAITATVPNGKPNQLVLCQDIEYKMAAVHKYFQATMGRAMTCHGAAGLWERATLDRIFYDHDTVFHGEDFVMGLALLRLRDDARIISCPQSIIPTYAPETWTMLFRQRVKSWELTSHKKTFTYISEFLNPASFCHAGSLILKPYFLQELLTILLDWVRMFLLAGLLLRDWLSLVLMTGMFSIVLYIQVIMLEFVFMRQRKDIRNGFWACALFPFYRFGGLLFRLCALIHNILVYSKDRKSLTIGYREDEIRDIAPCPPHPDVDWFTCWTDSPAPAVNEASA